MANIYSTITMTAQDFIPNVKSALISKYGAGFTILYEATTTDLIFTCPAISKKVIHIQFVLNNINAKISFADSWTSGTTLVNERLSLNCTYGNGMSWTGGHMVCGDTFILFNFTTSAGMFGYVTVIGLTTSNNDIYISYHGSNVYSTTISYIPDKSLNCTFVTPSIGYVGANNYLYKQKLMITMSNGQLLLNEDNSPATINGLYASSMAVPKTAPYIGDNFFISTASMFDSVGNTLPTGLLAEW